MGESISGESVQRFRRVVLRKVQEIVGCADEASDLVQTVLERLARHPPKQIGSVVAYLVKAALREAARRKAALERERQAWWEVCLGQSARGHTGGCAGVEEAALTRWGLREVRGRLTAEEAQILDLIVEQRSERDIACALGCTTHAVRRTRARIRRICGEVLGWKAGGEEAPEARKVRKNRRAGLAGGDSSIM